MDSVLSDYLSRTMHAPWAWGVSDCTLWVADWCIIRFCYDPAASLRGKYSDKAGADAIVGSDLCKAISPYMDSLAPTLSPRLGDVGVVVVNGAQVAAICCGEKWAFRTMRGIGEAPLRPLMAWGG